MNLGVFNRVNLKDSGGGMYSEWASLNPLIQRDSEERQSVLEKFSPGVGREVVLFIVKQLAANLGITQAAEPSSLNTDKEVQWCMEVICYGLSLPLTEHDTVRDCVNVYCEWLSALYFSPKISVPKPISDDPNFYARKMISHFHNLFVPRKGEGIDTINRQAVLCHRVLRTLQEVAKKTSNLDNETWESLLIFLIGINDELLAPPAVREDAGEQLCERVLGVLLEVWLVACERNFPSPPLWRTLRESCLRWRHRIALIEQWNRVCLALTAKLLSVMYGPLFPELKINDEDAQIVPTTMSEEAVAQAWYRLIRTIGDPVDLCRPAVISQTQAFLQYAIASPSVVDPCQHPCLQNLPQIFLKAIKGIAGQVDAFLGVSQACCWEECCAATSGSHGSVSSATSGFGSDRISNKDQPQPSPTPPTQRRLAKSFSVSPSAVTKGIPKSSLIGLTSSRLTNTPPIIANSGPSSTSSTASATSFGQDIRPPLAPGRPKCNSILHLFGEWLFEAAFIGTDGWSQNLPRTSKRPSSVLVEGPSSLQENISEIPTSLSIDRYEAGRAEAIGALCRIFCAKKTGEEILPVYLARFYQAMSHGLKVIEPRECGDTLASILSNSADLFRLDLDGVEVLVPSVLTALELVLPDKDLKLKTTSVSKIELRRSSIQLLISLLVLPLHYQNLPIRELHNLLNIGSNVEKNHLTFGQLKPRLMNLLINALQVETDPLNTHMLLGGLLLSVQDSATVEEIEQSAALESLAIDSSANLLTSVNCDSTNQISISSDSQSLNESSDVATVQEENPSFDSAHALFLRATYLVCHRLISSWKIDLNISLAALELLSGLARTKIRETDALECKRAVKWLCDYITYQCWRPPQAHSKDLHSSIVAAFGCLTTWLTAHSQLLQDKDCLTTILEVVELGISGSKSIGKPTEPVKMKHEKELKPASMRVRDAAEALLTVILEQVGYFPRACGAQSLSTLLDEASIIAHFNNNNNERFNRQAAVERFHYFVAENAIMLALLEEPLSNEKSTQPTITVIIRGPFGRNAWTMQLRHLPRHKTGVRSINSNLGRPLALAEPLPRTDYKPKFFPDNFDKISHCKVDESIPTLEAVMNDNDEVKDQHSLLAQFLDRQINLESQFCENFQKEKEENYKECSPPENCNEFQTARLFLSHFGFLNFETENQEDNNICGITALDPTTIGFFADLENLDHISSRTCDTVHIFYVKSGQKIAAEILNNVQYENEVSPHFINMLNSLGWPVNVSNHAGWTGHISTSWRTVQTSNLRNHNNDHGGSLYNGDTHILYWADVSSEIAFIVPTKSSILPQNTDSFDEISYSSDTSVNQMWYDNTKFGYSTSQSYNHSGRTMSLDLEKQPSSFSGSGPSSVSSNQETNFKPKRSTKHSVPWQTDTRIMIVWLESLEDYIHFPIGELLPYTHTGLESFRVVQSADVHVIFLQALTNGLLRVRLQGPVSRMNLATPLIDGMVVSRRVLGTLVRQTALNIGRRKRLDNDSYHPPHVRRRLKIQDMIQKYKKDLSQPELLNLLFSHTSMC